VRAQRDPYDRRAVASTACRNRVSASKAPIVLLLLDEQAEHRLGADEGNRQAVGVLARRLWASTSDTPVTVCSSPQP
jgi:hypothetical protein